jgi:6-phosphogluconolactonase (cycloisomerase 2 family)
MFKLFAILCFGVASAASASAQIAPSGDSQSDLSGSSPVAYVYVASYPGNKEPIVIVGYSASSKGALTPIPGSPFQENVNSMAVNGKYLMAVDSSSPPNIDTLKIGSNGSLTYITSTPCVQPGNGCIGARNLYFDHTGSDLYVMENQGDENSNTASYSVNESSGVLNYLGNTITGVFPGDYTSTFFMGNNVYAYSADQSACMYPGIYGYQRESSGLLNSISTQYNQPTPPPGVRAYYPDLLVADPTNNLAVLEQPANPPGCAPGPVQIAVYTADANGNLNTNSTYNDMPATKIQNPYDMKMSPSGKLLAVAGQEGLQVFHFNGSNPVTHYTGLLTKEPVTQMFWDNNNHLYAISNTAGELLVFTITPTTHRKAPGSPYVIPGAQDIIVQPLK